MRVFRGRRVRYRLRMSHLVRAALLAATVACSSRSSAPPAPIAAPAAPAPAPADPVPVEPTPAEPTPIEPAPVEPAPAVAAAPAAPVVPVPNTTAPSAPPKRLAASRVRALARDRAALIAAVGTAGVTVVRELGERPSPVATTVHACTSADVERALAAVHADLVRQVKRAELTALENDDPDTGITCAGARCTVPATNEGEPKFTLVFAAATADAPLTAVVERDDWQSADVDAHDAAIARRLASHRCP